MQFQSTPQEIHLTKISRRKDEIATKIVHSTIPIEKIVYRETRDYETYEEATARESFVPISPPCEWGGGANGWFKLAFRVPKEWKGREVAAFIDLGGEACVFKDRVPYQGLDKNHKELFLTKSAKGGERFEFVIDAVSCAPWDPEALNPEIDNAKNQFTRADIGVVCPEVRALHYDIEMLEKLARRLPVESPRRAKIIYTLTNALDSFVYDTSCDFDQMERAAKKVRRLLKPLFKGHANASDMEFSVVGHSHIDVAWKWPYKETWRKCARTFSTATRLAERYPEFIFSQGQASLYEKVRDNYPGLYDEIKKLVTQGRWDVTGSMYVEADCNLSGGESLVRQILFGKRFFLSEFGVETDVLWLPDVFGYSAALPQILKKCGVDYFATNKIHWSDINKFPYSTFYWEGIDGSRVLAHFPPSASYNGFPDPYYLRKYQSDFADKHISGDLLFSYGWGDGGGGPEARHVELLSRAQDTEGLPKCVERSIPDFFHKIDDGTEYEKWRGELYLEYHRGTYTTHARNKLFNRKSELLMREVEMLASCAESVGGDYPRQELSESWKKVLLMQFHDVIPGTSIRQVYEDTDRMYKQVFLAGEVAAGAALSKLAKEADTRGEGVPVVIFNSLGWKRRGLVTVDKPDDGKWRVVDGKGREVVAKDLGGRLVFSAKCPSVGYVTYRMIKGSPDKSNNDLTVSNRKLENKWYTIDINNDGNIESLILKSENRQVVEKGAVCNLLRLYEDKPVNWPAWDVDFYYEDKYEDLAKCDYIKVVEEGPVRAAIEIGRSFGDSKLRQRVVIYSDSPRIDFVTWVDWAEHEKLLRVLFPVNVSSDKARFDIQFGNVERTTTRNTSWDFAKFEVCAHKWADISEGDFGVALANDCKYGYSLHGNVMGLSLLRSQKRPDPHADMCEHTFTYSLIPHTGDYRQARVVREAYELNVPLSSIVTKPKKGKAPEKRSFVSFDSKDVVLETVKKAEESEDTILRLYECHNTRKRVRVRCRLPFVKVVECDMMEREVCELEVEDDTFFVDIGPYEIKTVKLVV